MRRLRGSSGAGRASPVCVFPDLEEQDSRLPLLRFRARGLCMYPVLLPDDVFLVKRCRVDEVAVGDIVVRRSGSSLVAHRVIEIGEVGGRSCLRTRADRSSGESDPPAFGDDLVGVVLAIERQRTIVPAADLRPARSLSCESRARVFLLSIWSSLRPLLDKAMAIAQCLPGYSALARPWLLRARSRLRFKVRVPLGTGAAEGLYAEIDPDRFDPEDFRKGSAVSSWLLVAFMEGRACPAGHVEAVKVDGCWSLLPPVVRRRYRGTGLADVLATEARRLLIFFEGSGGHRQP